MNFTPTDIPDVVIVEPKVFGDERGHFYEVWNQSVFEDAKIAIEGFVQDNHSRSSKGTLRGLHYQIEQAQGKLVRCTVGSVFDVAVDLRSSSSTFKQWVGFELTAENKRQLWIPPGFAHGFYVLSEVAEFQYKCTDFYATEHERTLSWNDPELGVQWPIEDGVELLISDKDRAGLSLSECPKY